MKERSIETTARESGSDHPLGRCFAEKDSDGVSELVFWSFRYFLGRMTAATPCFARNLEKAWPHLSGSIQRSIREELEKAIQEDDSDRLNDRGHNRLGMDCDRRAWECVLVAANAEVPNKASISNALFTEYVDYIKNAGGGTVAVNWFDEDWEPIGSRIRDDMKKAGIITESNGIISLANA